MRTWKDIFILGPYINHKKKSKSYIRTTFLTFCLVPLVGASFWVAALDEDTQTLPAQTCKEALDVGLNYDASIPAPSSAPNPLPFPNIPIVEKGKRLPPIYKGNERVRPPRAYLPYDLSMQPLEGNPKYRCCW